jgi:UDP-N-acetylmuramoyl-tripeptide--D-alanyl-D-alanine ligase
MNEMGRESAQMHEEIGAYCDPAKLQLLVTIGQEARDYIAAAAQKNGCEVASFNSPYEAGAYVKQQLHKGAVVLAKGSQNGVFAEESIKPLLANQADEAKLVRQSEHWLNIKKRQFSAS